MSIFAEAIVLLVTVESHLIDESESRFPTLAGRVGLVVPPYPLKFLKSLAFLKLGMSEKIKSVVLYVVLSNTCLALGWFVQISSGTYQAKVQYIMMMMSMIVPLFYVIFALPSRYIASGIAQTSVDFVEQHLYLRGFSDLKDIELLKKTIKPLEDRARSRVTILKWLVGLLWAGFIYTFSRSIDAGAMQPISYIMTLAPLLVAVAAAYIMVWGYEVSLDKLFRLVEFGCNDHCHAIQRTAVAAG